MHYGWCLWLILLTSSLLASPLQYSNKWGYKRWQDQSKYGLKLSGDIRHNGSSFFYHHYDIGGRYKHNKTWSSGLVARIIFKEKDKNWSTNYRPYAELNGTFQTPMFKWGIRNRLEYHVNAPSKAVRARAQLRATYPLFSWRPFIGNEFFLDLSTRTYNKNWFILGITIPNVRFNPRVYYKHVSNKKNGIWDTPTHALVLQLSI
ncbi:MAG: DUF2490 domain-containing protein [Candidatus Marinamargulisbacteria bacterium]